MSTPTPKKWPPLGLGDWLLIAAALQALLAIVVLVLVVIG